MNWDGDLVGITVGSSDGDPVGITIGISADDVVDTLIRQLVVFTEGVVVGEYVGM